jgi:hypothetical protein
MSVKVWLSVAINGSNPRGVEVEHGPGASDGVKERSLLAGEQGSKMDGSSESDSGRQGAQVGGESAKEWTGGA